MLLVLVQTTLAAIVAAQLLSKQVINPPRDTGRLLDTCRVFDVLCQCYRCVCVCKQVGPRQQA